MIRTLLHLTSHALQISRPVPCFLQKSSMSVVLTIARHATKSSFTIDADLWVVANALSSSFQEAEEATVAPSGELGLLARWIAFIKEKKSDLDLLKASLNALHSKIFPQNIHVAVASLEDAPFILATYYSVYSISPKFTSSALLSDPSANVYGLFGGQVHTSWRSICPLSNLILQQLVMSSIVGSK